MSKHVRILTISTIIILLIGVGAGAFLLLNQKNESSQTQSPDTTQPVAPSAPQTSDTEKQTDIPVAVFFSHHPQSDDDPTEVFPVDRVSPDLGVATYVIQQLLVGPTAQEADDGYFSTVRVRNDASTCDNKDFTLTVKNTVATLQFCRTFDAIGTISDAQAQQTINASLMQFSTIQNVIILSKDGDCQFDMSGENRCLI